MLRMKDRDWGFTKREREILDASMLCNKYVKIVQIIVALKCQELFITYLASSCVRKQPRTESLYEEAFFIVRVFVHESSE